MEYQDELRGLRSELSLGNDNVDIILRDACNGFVKKYHSHFFMDHKELEKELKSVQNQIDLYVEYTHETLAKFGSMKKLRTLFRTIIESQKTLLSITCLFIDEYAKKNEHRSSQVSDLTQKVSERCANCDGVLYRAKLENIKDEVDVKFKDPYSYYLHDIGQINRIEEQAMLILRKKNLGVQQLSEMEYIGKLEKMGEHMFNTIEHVNQSLLAINSFHSKIDEIQEYQENLEKEDFEGRPFNPNLFMLKLSKHFFSQIQRVEEKLDSIKKYFIFSKEAQAQTIESGGYVSMETISQLKKQIAGLENQHRQTHIQKNSLEELLLDANGRAKFYMDGKETLETEIEQCKHSIKGLEIQLEKQRCSKANSPSHSTLSKPIPAPEHQKCSISNSPEEESSSIDTQHFPEKIEYKDALQSLKEREDFCEQNFLQKMEKDRLLKERRQPSFMFSKKPNLNEKAEAFKERAGKKRKRGNMESFYEQRRPTFQDTSTLPDHEEKSTLPGHRYIAQPEHSESSTHRAYDLQIVISGNIATFGTESKSVDGQEGTREQTWSADPLLLQFFEEYKSRPKSKGSQETKSMVFSDFKKKVIDLLEQDKENSSQGEGEAKAACKLGKSDKLQKKSFSSFGHTLPEKRLFQQKGVNGNRNSQQKILMPDKYRFEIPLEAVKAEGRGDLQGRKQLTDKNEPSKEEGCKLGTLRLGESSRKKLKHMNRFSEAVESHLSLAAARAHEKALLKRSASSMNARHKMSLIEEFGPLIMQREFSEKEVTLVYHSLENAFELGQVLGSRKSQLKLVCEEDNLSAGERGYLCEFFAVVAKVHLCNQEGYEKVRLFLLSPYDSVVSQISTLKIFKNAPCSSLMREALMRILLLHRRCIVKNQICKHLRYLFRKVQNFLDLDSQE